MKKIIVFILLLWIKSVQAQNFPLANTVLWKVSGNGLQKESFIYLTTSTCNETVKWKPKVQNAINSADAIVVESNLTGKDAMQKLRANFVVINDSQRIKNVFTNAQYQEFSKYFKDQGATNEVMDQFNNVNIAMLYTMRVSELSPCDRTVRTEKPEEVLKTASDKGSKSYIELQSVDELLAESSLHTNLFWQQNMWYAFKNEELLKQSISRKIDLYNAENLSDLQDLFKNDRLFQLLGSDEVNKHHIEHISVKIEEQIRSGARFIQVNINNVLWPDTSLFSNLQKNGFTLTPVLE